MINDLWFPVAPGVTSLPSLSTNTTTTTVNITGTDDDGNTIVIGTQTVMTANGVVTPFNETVILAPRVRVGLDVKSYPYALSVATSSVALITKAKLAVNVKPPIPVSSITYSQSSTYSANTDATNATMTNGLLTGSSTGTNDGTLEWIKMDLGASYEVAKLVVGTATTAMPGGWSKADTENADIEYSTDNSTWTNGGNIGTFASEGIYQIAVSFTARYIRLKKASAYLGLMEFYVLAEGQTYP